MPEGVVSRIETGQPARTEQAEICHHTFDMKKIEHGLFSSYQMYGGIFLQRDTT